MCKGILKDIISIQGYASMFSRPRPGSTPIALVEKTLSSGKGALII